MNLVRTLRPLTCIALILLSSTYGEPWQVLITPAEFVTISHGENITIVCQTQPQRALADCGFQIAPPSPAGPLYANSSAAGGEYWNLTFKYDGEGLSGGQCRLLLKASPLYKEESFPVGCRVRVDGEGWKYGYTSIVDTSWLPKEISLSTVPKEEFLLPGSRLTVRCDSANGFVLEKCSFKLPGLDKFDLSPTMSHGDFKYIGNGLDRYQCGISIPDVGKVVNDTDDVIMCETQITYKKVPTREVRVNTARCEVAPETLLGVSKDKVQEIQCTTPACRPPATIEWFLDGELVPTSNVTEQPVDKWRQQRDLEATTQVFRVDLTPEILGKKVECRVVHLAGIFNDTYTISSTADPSKPLLVLVATGVSIFLLMTSY